MSVFSTLYIDVDPPNAAHSSFELNATTLAHSGPRNMSSLPRQLPDTGNDLVDFIDDSVEFDDDMIN